jgi:D-glycero-D-manno-heptose 1,7-bisphosphate phosphatase
MKRAVFFDRDGTLIEEVGYLASPDQVRLKAGAAVVVRRLNAAGFLVVVISNQSAVARGMCTTDDVERANDRLGELMAQEGARLDGFYYCPHLPTGTVPAYAKECDCRKPKPGLLYEAAQDLDVDLTESTVVGDAVRDVQAGRAARCHTIFTGDLSRMDAGARGQVEVFADATLGSIAEAVDLILSSCGPGAPEEANPEAAPTPARAATASPPKGLAGSPLAAPAAGGTGSQTCSRCGRPVDEEALVEGKALAREEGVLCPACVAELGTQQSASPQQTPADWQSILEELRAINRSLSFESFSLINVLGGIIQVGALGCLFKAYYVLSSLTPAGGATWLLWAMALQLLTLTCFSLGRR